jgi:hypothetical protein
LQHVLINKSINSIQEEDETPNASRVKKINLMAPTASKLKKNSHKTRVKELESSLFQSSTQGSAKIIKVYDMWKENHLLQTDPIEH